MIDSLKGRLAKAPINELNLENTKLRRAIIKAGFNSIIDVLELSEKDIDSTFSIDNADAIIAMQKRFNKDPNDFAASVLKKKEINNEEIESILKKHAAEESAITNSAPSPKHHTYHSNDGPRVLPPTKFSEVLKDFEQRAKEVPGLKDRIGFMLDFDNYTPLELAELLERDLRAKGLALDEMAKAASVDAFARAIENEGEDFSNGRFVRRVAERCAMRAYLAGKKMLLTR